MMKTTIRTILLLMMLFFGVKNDAYGQGLADSVSVSVELETAIHPLDTISVDALKVTITTGIWEDLGKMNLFLLDETGVFHLDGVGKTVVSLQSEGAISGTDCTVYFYRVQTDRDYQVNLELITNTGARLPTIITTYNAE